jgi:hypothetical protein
LEDLILEAPLSGRNAGRILLAVHNRLSTANAIQASGQRRLHIVKRKLAEIEKSDPNKEYGLQLGFNLQVWSRRKIDFLNHRFKPVLSSLAKKNRLIFESAHPRNISNSLTTTLHIKILKSAI